MFAALEWVSDPPKSIRERIMGILSKPQPEVQEMEAAGVRYYVIRARLRGQTPDWDSIREVAGRLADRMLFPDDWEPPASSGLQALDCPAFERRVLLATACDLVKYSQLPLYRRVLGLLDPDGSCVDMLPVLLRHYTSLRVMTANVEAYQPAAEAMMEQLGAPVLIGDHSAALADCALLFAPGEGLEGKPMNYSCPVLAGSRFRPRGHLALFSAPEAAVPDWLAAHAPAGIALHRFAAALHDSGQAEIDATPAHLLHNYRRCTVKEAAAILTRQAALSS